MREILFRGKCVEHGEWVEGWYYPQYDDISIAYILDNVGGFVHEVIPETVCQFTGLTDKNGNKIWEGDILKGGIFLEYEVKWDYEDCGWNITESALNFVVIGNIHDKQPTL